MAIAVKARLKSNHKSQELRLALVKITPILLLAFLNRRSENVIVKAIIIPELEFGNVKVKVLSAHVVEGPHDTAPEDAPKALNRLGMNGTDNVLVLGIVHGTMGKTKQSIPSPCGPMDCFAEPVIGRAFARPGGLHKGDGFREGLNPSYDLRLAPHK